jgi:hypothetical protein
MKQEEITGYMEKLFHIIEDNIQLLSPDPVFGKSSIQVAYHQDRVFGSFIVQAFAGSICTVLLYASRSGLNKNRESLRRFKI